jgi:hypothetical protein
MKWSEDNSVLTDAQFGFRPGYGTQRLISIQAFNTSFYFIFGKGFI